MIPTEAQEQKAVVAYCKYNQLPCFRVPNETYTTSWKQKMNNKQLGVSKGIPDLFVIVNNQLIAIEMKRIKGSVTSPEQLEWLRLLNMANIPAKVCKGSQEAIDYIESFIKKV